MPGAGGMARDTGTCSRARIEVRNCSIRTLPLAPPALSTPAGGTRRPSAPPGTSLRNATHLNSRSCFVLIGIEPGVKATSLIRPPLPDVFEAAAKPPILHILPLRRAWFRGSRPVAAGYTKAPILIDAGDRGLHCLRASRVCPSPCLGHRPLRDSHRAQSSDHRHPPRLDLRRVLHRHGGRRPRYQQGRRLLEGGAAAAPTTRTCSRCTSRCRSRSPSIRTASRCRSMSMIRPSL